MHLSTPLLSLLILAVMHSPSTPTYLHLTALSAAKLQAGPILPPRGQYFWRHGARSTVQTQTAAVTLPLNQLTRES